MMLGAVPVTPASSDLLAANSTVSALQAMCPTVALIRNADGSYSCPAPSLSSGQQLLISTGLSGTIAGIPLWGWLAGGVAVLFLGRRQN
jgi:hypothetical protein